MRILHVMDISIPMLAGYTSRGKYIVNTQRSLGLDPVVLTSVRHDTAPGCAVETIDGMRYHRTLPGTGLPAVRERVEQTPVAREAAEIDHLRRRIVEVAKEEQPDIIHGHSSILCGIPAFLASRQLGLPCVYEIRAFWEDAAVDSGKNAVGSPRYNAIKRAETELAKQVDALIGICDGIKNELVGRGIPADDVFTVPNGVDIDKFVPMERDEAIADKYGLSGKTVVAYIGTFAAFEGVPFLVEALVKLIEGGRDDVAGLIVGAGATYDRCKQIAADAGLSDRIVHPGRVSHDEVRPIYSVVDILAYPRDRQRITELVTPLKPLEAMAMKKSVIGSDVGGLLELITDGETGLIHRAEDVGDLAQKIERLLDDVALRETFGERGRDFVTTERTWRRSIERHFDVYDRARRNWDSRSILLRGMSSIVRRLGKGL